MTSGVEGASAVFLVLLLFVVVFALLARRLHTPYPIVLVVAGLALSLVPGRPTIELNPDVVFYVVLPPLLYAAAWATSWREFSHNLVSIVSLACGLVTFTIVGVSVVAHWLFPGFDWRLGVILGAVVAPTDAIAATAIATRIGLPRRIADLLEGESLVNDATGLLAVEFGLALAMGNESPTVAAGLLRFGYLVVGGLGVGVVVAAAVDWLERRIDDGPIEIAISLLVPYAAYLGAETIHASGVLAVVACGLLLSRRSAEFFSPSVRLQIYAVWSAIVFILNGVVFVRDWPAVVGDCPQPLWSEPAAPRDSRRPLQRTRRGAAARVADARRPPLIFHSPSFPASNRCPPAGARAAGVRMERDARRRLAGGGGGAPADVAEWRTIPSAKHDRVPHFQRRHLDARRPGADARASRARARTNRGDRSEL